MAFLLYTQLKRRITFAFYLLIVYSQSEQKRNADLNSYVGLAGRCCIRIRKHLRSLFRVVAQFDHQASDYGHFISFELKLNYLQHLHLHFEQLFSIDFDFFASKSGKPFPKKCRNSETNRFLSGALLNFDVMAWGGNTLCGYIFLHTCKWHAVQVLIAQGECYLGTDTCSIIFKIPFFMEMRGFSCFFSLTCCWMLILIRECNLREIITYETLTQTK